MNELVVPNGVTDIKPIRTIVYEFLKDAILEGKIKPGERLVERDIAEKFNASRTPIREALRKLESEGLLQYVPRKGDIVRAIDQDEVRETYAIRKALECLAIESAVQRLTPQFAAELARIIEQTRQADKNKDIDGVMQGLSDFDAAVLNHAGPMLKSFIQTLQESLRRYRRINLAGAPRRESAISEHAKIAEAIAAGDVEGAKRAVCEHIDSAQRQLLKNWGVTARR